MVDNNINQENEMNDKYTYSIRGLQVINTRHCRKERMKYLVYMRIFQTNITDTLSL
jgi:hypothetical protein